MYCLYEPVEVIILEDVLAVLPKEVDQKCGVWNLLTYPLCMCVCGFGVFVDKGG